MNTGKLKTIIKYYFLKLLAFLRLKSIVAGLEVSDAALRLATFDGKAWRMSGVRLEPDVMEKGEIKDHEKFVAALKALKSKILNGGGEDKKINTVVSLSSISIYSQVFSLPIVEGESLDKAIQLNVQMVSPVESSQAYSGWQLVGRDQDALRLEILSAFIERATVDKFSKALFEAGFLVVALESRALALSRVLRVEGEGIDVARSYTMVSIDGSGIDFLIIRQGQLYFEYFNPWRDIMDENGQVSMDLFRTTITRSLHQVLNFYGQHWSDPVNEVVLSATALGEEAKKVIEENFSTPVRFLFLKLGQAVGPEWYIALGSGLRGLVPRRQDKELSLLGFGAEEEFRREQLIDFVRFWRLVMPVSLGALVVIFFLADLFVIQTRRALESQSLFNLSNEQLREGETLQAEAKEFNKTVLAIRSAQNTAFLKSGLLEKLANLMSASGISLTDFNFQSEGQPVSLVGSARSEDKIISFKNALAADPQFGSVNLPLISIVESPDGVSFSMSFAVKR